MAMYYQNWQRRLTELYIKISDLPMEPDSLHDMVDQIYSLAGAVQDFGLIYSKKNMENRSEENREWLLNQAIRRYYDSLEKLVFPSK